MIDSATRKPIRALPAETGPYIRVSREQLDRLRKFLDDNGVSFWVDDFSISIDGKPALTVVHAHPRTDPRQLQDRLDAVA